MCSTQNSPKYNSYYSYINSYYNDLGGYYYNKVLSGNIQIIEAEEKRFIINKEFNNTDKTWSKTKQIIESTLNVKIKPSGALDYYMDLQTDLIFERLYFSNLIDRIIFRINNYDFKIAISEYLKQKFKNVNFVGENELLQIIP